MEEKKMSFSEKEDITAKRIFYVAIAFGLVGYFAFRPLLALAGLLAIAWGVMKLRIYFRDKHKQDQT